LEKCRLFTYRELGVAVHLEPVGADQVLRPPYWKNVVFFFTYRQLTVAVHLEPVGADQVLRPPYWKNVVFSLTAS
jgi:hypothetical protein